MSLPIFLPDLLYGIVEYLPESDHIYDLVDTPPELLAQYRVIGLAFDLATAEQMACFWQAMANKRALSQPKGFAYTTCPMTPTPPQTDEPLALYLQKPSSLQVIKEGTPLKRWLFGFNLSATVNLLPSPQEDDRN